MSQAEALKTLQGSLVQQAEIRFPGQPTVFGVGPATAAVALIGEAPGKTEVEEGRPFAGKAGKNMDEFLALSGIPRDRLYITNVVKLRPIDVVPTGRLRNRPPRRDEIAFFLPFLDKELRLLSPRLLVTLGNVPLRALAADDSLTVGQTHGRVIPSRCGLPLYPLYHPASVIYNRSLGDIYIADVQRLSTLLTERNLLSF